MKLVRFITAKRRVTWGWIDPKDESSILEPVGLSDGIEGVLFGEAAELNANVHDVLSHSLDDVSFLAPIPNPSKLIAVGRNYHEHAAESGNTVPERPMLFGIFPSSISGPFDEIVLPPQSTKVDWEGELGVVIGKRARGISAADALEYIAGYLVLNDVSARDLQRQDQQWSRAKSFDSFKPCGPCIVTTDELGAADNLRLSVQINGVTMQNSNTSQMVFDVPYLLEYISASSTLLPGDIIATGTPSGVGFGQTPEVFLKDGDTVTTEIEGIGRMVNKVVNMTASAVAAE